MEVPEVSNPTLFEVIFILSYFVNKVSLVKISFDSPTDDDFSDSSLSLNKSKKGRRQDILHEHRQRTNGIITNAQNGTEEGDGAPVQHRASCHRCGNIRRNNIFCSHCPYIYCARCSYKMIEEYGQDIFVDGCPVCKQLCCCANKSRNCKRQCPTTKISHSTARDRDLTPVPLQSGRGSERRTKQSHPREVPFSDYINMTREEKINHLKARLVTARGLSSAQKSPVQLGISPDKWMVDSFRRDALGSGGGNDADCSADISSESPCSFILSRTPKTMRSISTMSHATYPSLGRLLLQGTSPRHQTPLMDTLFLPTTPISSTGVQTPGTLLPPMKSPYRRTGFGTERESELLDSPWPSTVGSSSNSNGNSGQGLSIGQGVGVGVGLGLCGSGSVNMNNSLLSERSQSRGRDFDDAMITPRPHKRHRPGPGPGHGVGGGGGLCLSEEFHDQDFDFDFFDDFELDQPHGGGGAGGGGGGVRYSDGKEKNMIRSGGIAVHERYDVDDEGDGDGNGGRCVHADLNGTGTSTGNKARNGDHDHDHDQTLTQALLEHTPCDLMHALHWFDTPESESQLQSGSHRHGAITGVSTSLSQLLSPEGSQ
eukprot:gene8057-16515_t